ncbi:MAG: hypothetical protein NC336_09840, partial [Clostridium sp.]|nr:hypothetical protein [Clostridium sp.]
MNPLSTTTPTTLPQEMPVASRRRGITIGLPKCSDPNELRFPLTPEGARMLVEEGFTVRMQADAAASIHYTDNQYARCGVDIV